MPKNTLIIIPARYGSSRFPGKPLAVIEGKSLLNRTWLIGKEVKGADEVYVATDDERLLEHAQSFGGKAIMTSSECRNGTERVLEALEKIKEAPDLVVNLQGDAVLTPPWVIEALIEAMKKDSSVEIATPATKLDTKQYEALLNSKKSGQAAGTTVTFDRNGNALYFSKSVIPFIRTANSDDLPVYRHIGLYAYRYPTLKKLNALEAGPFEKAEQLEQLRALENGIQIRVVQVDYQGRSHWSVDSPEDAEKVAEIIKKEGELCGSLSR